MRKFFKIAFFTYILLIIIAVVFPTHTVGITGMDETYVATIRLDHFLHLLVFMPLYPLAWYAFPQKSYSHKLLLYLCLLILAALAEMLQLLVSYRSFNYIDMLSNVVGVLLGAISLHIIKLRFFPEVE